MVFTLNKLHEHLKKKFLMVKLLFTLTKKDYGIHHDYFDIIDGVVVGNVEEP